MDRHRVRRVGGTAVLCGVFALGAWGGPAGLAGPAASPEPGPRSATVFGEGVISDAREQWRITFSPDGKTAYFASSDAFFPFTRRATIYVSRFAGGRWSTPEVASFSGTHSDIDPSFSPDGRRLYFSSIRPVDGVARADIDLWMVERTAGGWGEPVHLGAQVNSPGSDELYPSVSADGTLYFASGPPSPEPDRHFDIFSAKREGSGFAPRGPVEGINTAPAAGGGLQDAPAGRAVPLDRHGDARRPSGRVPLQRAGAAALAVVPGPMGREIVAAGVPSPER